MNIRLSNGGETTNADVPYGSEVGCLREARYRDNLEEIGVPGSYTFAVNGKGVEDTYQLKEGDDVQFRPKNGDKGALG